MNLWNKCICEASSEDGNPADLQNMDFHPCFIILQGCIAQWWNDKHVVFLTQINGEEKGLEINSSCLLMTHLHVRPSKPLILDTYFHKANIKGLNPLLHPEPRFSSWKRGCETSWKAKAGSLAAQITWQSNSLTPLMKQRVQEQAQALFWHTDSELMCSKGAWSPVCRNSTPNLRNWHFCKM